MFSTGKPFNPTEVNFINNIKPDQTIHIQLVEQDEQGRFKRIVGSVGGMDKPNTF